MKTHHPFKSPRGFTLIELLTVMAIIAIISGIALASYINMQSGGKYLSLARNIQNQVMLARQQAMLQNRPTNLLLSVSPYQDNMFSGSFGWGQGGYEEHHEIAVCFHAGVVTAVDAVGNVIQNAFAEPPALFTVKTLDKVNMIIYNFETGRRHESGGAEQGTESIIYPGTIYTDRRDYERIALEYPISGASSFQKGHAYGLLLAQAYRLPKNITFTEEYARLGDPSIIQFDRNGVMYWKQRGGGAKQEVTSEISFDMMETIRQQNITVTIKNNGIVTVDKKGES